MHSIAKNRLVHGVGINDADYVVKPTINGKTAGCLFHRCWENMLRRCYSKEYQSRNPTYIDCKVCDEWHSFMTFRVWMQKQDWKSKQLDKDLIGDGKLYSPETCAFVSSALNTLFADNGAIRGKYPIGVCWDKQKRKFSTNIKANGKQKFLGYFASADDAHAAWLAAKITIAKTYLANETNPRVRYAIECGIAKLK